MIDLNTLKSNLAAGMREVDAETAKDLVALTERLQSELTAAHEQLGYTAKPNDSQDWSKISGAVAHQLIERHADDWREAGDMMEAFAASRAAARPAVALSDEQIEVMVKEEFDKRIHATSNDVIRAVIARALLAAAGNSQGQAAQTEQQPVAYCAKTVPNLKERPAFNPLDPCRPDTADVFVNVTVPRAAPVPAAAPEPVFKEVGSFLYEGCAYVATSGDDPRGIKLYRPVLAAAPVGGTQP